MSISLVVGADRLQRRLVGRRQPQESEPCMSDWTSNIYRCLVGIDSSSSTSSLSFVLVAFFF